MNNIKFRRISAYLIDYLFIFLIITMLSQIRVLNPTYDEYYEAYDRYMEIYDDLSVDNALEIAESAEYQEVNYDLSRYSVSISIISLVVYLAYFVGFQKWNKNQTLGKKMFNIEVVSNDGKSASWLQILLREVIIYNIVWEILVIISIFVFNYEGYMIASSVLSLIAGIILWVSVLFIIFRKDGRGLHDIIAKTKVVGKEEDNGN